VQPVGARSVRAAVQEVSAERQTEAHET